jgi:NAD(P)H-hydrate epimerase
MTPQATLCFSRAALREMDRRAVEEFRIPILVLMENAGRAVADAARHMLKHGGSVLIVCGPGNNGGDGLVAARHLHNAGVAVEILLLADPVQFRDAAAMQLAIVHAMKLHVQTISTNHQELRNWLAESHPNDLIVDAIFGTGLSRPVEGLARDVIEAINKTRHAVLAVDIPSGLDCDTGLPLGIAVKAATTVSFCGTKMGFANAAAYTGKVMVGDIGAPVELLRELALP